MATTLTLKVPTVHNNGTSGNDLLIQLTKALHAGRDFIKALSDAAPNGRDYYVQEPDAFRRATDEHNNRVARVASVMLELEQIAEAVADQNDLRRR